MVVPCTETCMHANESCCTRKPRLKNSCRMAVGIHPRYHGIPPLHVLWTGLLHGTGTLHGRHNQTTRSFCWCVRLCRTLHDLHDPYRGWQHHPSSISTIIDTWWIIHQHQGEPGSTPARTKSAHWDAKWGAKNFGTQNRKYGQRFNQTSIPVLTTSRDRQRQRRWIELNGCTPWRYWHVRRETCQQCI